MVDLRTPVNTAPDSGYDKACDANEHKHNALNTSSSVCVVVAESTLMVANENERDRFRPFILGAPADEINIGSLQLFDRDARQAIH